MPAVFHLAAMAQAPLQSAGLTSGRSTLDPLPPGQTRFGASGPSSGAAPFGAGAPVATGAVTAPTALTPHPAPAPVVSTSQTGAMLAAAINGGAHSPEDARFRGRGGEGGRHDSGSFVQVATFPAPRGLPGGPAPGPKPSAGGDAVPHYNAARFAFGD